MLSPLANRTFARLFTAQVSALLGTGLLTIALGLLAYDLAGENAALVLGMAYAIKMVAYVGLSPVVAALTANIPRRRVLITADLARVLVALSLPFVTQIWQIWLAIALLQAASATFTPAFQATIPDILPDEKEYTKALSLSRLALDFENLLSPLLAGVALMLVSFHWLFIGTGIGFLISAALITQTVLPAPPPTKSRRFIERLTLGTRIYLATPRLRGLLALILAAAASSAFVIVGSVTLVRDFYHGNDADLAIALAAYGAGSMLAALVLPKLLDRIPDRTIMFSGAVTLTVFTFGHGLWRYWGEPGWTGFLLLWV